MSDFEAYHAAADERVSAIFEELYDSRGQPSELDSAFVKEYLARVAEDASEDPDSLPEPGSIDLTILPKGAAQQLVDVAPSAGDKKLLVQRVSGGTKVPFTGNLPSDIELWSKWFYSLREVKGFPCATLVNKDNNARYVLVSLGTHPVGDEGGNGVWEQA